MNKITNTLRDLHHIHQLLSDLRERHERGPRQIAVREASVSLLEAELTAVKEEQKRARIHADQKELQLKSGEDKITNLKTKLNICSSNREYQALKEQIAADEMAISVLSDEILEAYEKVDEFKDKIKDAEERFTQSRAELEKARDVVAGQQTIIEGDITRLETDLVATEARLPPEIRESYLRVIRAKGSEGMAPVEGESCGGCYQSIRPNMFNHLKMGELTFCGSCGRLLYLRED